MKPDPLTEPQVRTLTEARPFVVSSVSLVVQLGGVWWRLWRKQKTRLQAKCLCVTARGLRMELTLTCSVTSQRREGGGLGSGLHLTVGAAPRCCRDGRRSRLRSVVGNSPQISYLKTGMGTLRLQRTGLVLVDGFPPSSLLLCLLYRDVRPADVVVVMIHWRFVPPAGGSWGDRQEINTTYTIAPKNSWSCSYQLRLQCYSFLWLLILKLGEEFQNTLSREKEVTVSGFCGVLSRKLNQFCEWYHWFLCSSWQSPWQQAYPHELLEIRALRGYTSPQSPCLSCAAAAFSSRGY